MKQQQEHDSHLFLVRFWKAETNDAPEPRYRKEMSGRVQHVLSGEAHTFHDWPTLVDLMLAMAKTDEIDAAL